MPNARRVRAGGKIHVQSEAGVGTRFRFSFPPQSVQVRLSLAASRDVASRAVLAQ